MRRAPLELAERWVLVTGASSGLGRAIAARLAQHHRANLVLVARREDRLQQLAASLESEHGTRCVVIAADLSRPAEVDRAFATATDGRSLDAGVLNAGVTHFGRTLDLPWERFEQMLGTNVTGLTRLSKLCVRHFVERANHGALLIIASLGGIVPLPYQSDYAAMKAFAVQFGRCLHHEVAPLGVSVTVFAPGGIDTEMLESSGLTRVADSHSRAVMQADQCARHAIRALLSRSYIYVPGLLNRLADWAARLAPRRWLGERLRRTYARGLDERP